MLNAKIVLVASTLTLALAAAFIFYGVVMSGNSDYSSFYLEGTRGNSSIYLTVFDNIVTYDFLFPILIQNMTYIHLYRLTSDTKSEFYNKFIHTLIPEEKINNTDFVPIWDCEASTPEVVSDTTFTAEVKENLITINYRGEEANISLNESGQPTTFGEFNVKKFYFKPISSNVGPTGNIPVRQNTCNGKQIKNVVSEPGTRLLRERKLVAENPYSKDVQICALWLAAIAYNEPGMEPLINVGSCGNDDDGNPITILAFQGTQVTTIKTVIADIFSLWDNWNYAVEQVEPHLTDEALKPYNLPEKSHGKKFDVCSGHSLGGVTARAVDNKYRQICNSILTFGAPIGEFESNTPITQYINIGTSIFCIERKFWWPFECETTLTGFVRDVVTYVGYLDGYHVNVKYLFDDKLYNILNYDSIFDGGVGNSGVQYEVSLHPIRTLYKDNWCQINEGAFSTQANCPKN